MESKKWEKPSVEEIIVKEDSTSMDCQGKRIGCYAGSSCGSIESSKNLEKDEEKQE